ncbi:hypothetical protein ACWIUD_08575 [Helicobacter sp. 23-1044]
MRQCAKILRNFGFYAGFCENFGFRAGFCDFAVRDSAKIVPFAESAFISSLRGVAKPQRSNPNQIRHCKTLQSEVVAI